jgi:hypothetical protein
VEWRGKVKLRRRRWTLTAEIVWLAWLVVSKRENKSREDCRSVLKSSDESTSQKLNKNLTSLLRVGWSWLFSCLFTLSLLGSGSPFREERNIHYHKSQRKSNVLEIFFPVVIMVVSIPIRILISYDSTILL